MKSSSLIYQQIVNDVFYAITSMQVGKTYRGAFQWLELLGYEPTSIEASLFTALFVQHCPRYTINANNNQILEITREEK